MKFMHDFFFVVIIMIIIVLTQTRKHARASVQVLMTFLYRRQTASFPYYFVIDINFL